MQIKPCKLSNIFFLLLYVNISSAQTWKELNPPPNIFNGRISAVTTDTSGNIYAAGHFKNENNEYIVAKLTGLTWDEVGIGSSALKAGSAIICMTSDNAGNIYAAGFVNGTGNYSVSKWDGSKWTEVGGATNALNPNGLIYAITVDNSGNVYVAGGLTNTGGKQYVAKWNGTNWSETGSGVNSLNANGLIYSLTNDNAGNVYAAGRFTNSNGKYYVAKWNGAYWTELGASAPLNANDYINCIKADNAGNVYAGGAFKNSSDDYYITRWNGTNWNEVGSGTNALKANSPINAIEVNTTTGNIYTGGFGGNLVEWNGNSWNQIFAAGNLLNSTIWSICLDKAGNVYAAGDFKNNGGHQYVVKWDGNTASEPGRFGEDLHDSQAIFKVVVDSKGEVYAAGNFLHPGGFYYIQHWNGKTWNELGGDTASLDLLSANVGMTTDTSGNLYVTGYFTNQNGKYYIAKWDGHSWSELGDPSKPIKIYEPTTLLTTDRVGNIYAAGAFGDSSGFSYTIMKWDGSDWFLYPYVLNPPASLFVDTLGNIYAGSTDRDPVENYFVQKIDKNGATMLGSGATALKSATAITAIAVDAKGNVLASGLNNAGFSPYNKFVAKWDGTKWSISGPGNNNIYSDGYVHSMTADDSGYVYAGSYTNTNNRYTVAKWDGNNWSDLGNPPDNPSPDNIAYTLAVDVKGNIYAAGLFSNSPNNRRYVAVYGESALLLELPVTSTVANQYCSTSGLQRIKITNLPGTSWISARVTLDNTVLVVNADSSFTFTPSSLSTGNHRFRISFNSRSDSVFIIKDFAIVVPATPTVNVTASTTTVITMDPVNIIATNASGGGSAPAFTFAKNRGMTQILQSESQSNTFNLNPAILSIGDNWIYVQMRTSELCYTTLTNIDSIKINRSAITGIRDIDYPGREIIVYPVPSNGQFSIKGLHSSKTYQVSVITSLGQKIYEKKTSGYSSININLPALAKGTYWLIIYDNTKRRMLGAIPLIKE